MHDMRSDLKLYALQAPRTEQFASPVAIPLAYRVVTLDKELDKLKTIYDEFETKLNRGGGGGGGGGGSGGEGAGGGRRK